MAENPTLVPGSEIVTESIEISSDGFDLKVYQAKPTVPGPFPAVIVIHENRGLVSYLRDVANGLASSGYFAVAPDLLSREGGTYSFQDINKEIPEKLQTIQSERHTTDVQTVINYLNARDDIGRIGIIGFCFGGAVVWNLIIEAKDIAAAVPFYGTNPPLAGVPNIHTAVFAVYGDLDERVNAGLPAIKEALEAAGIEHHISVYPSSLHGFLNHRNPERYNPASAHEAWSDALAWLDQHLRS